MFWTTNCAVYLRTLLRLISDEILSCHILRARWFNKCLTDCFDTWHDEIFVETYALYQEVQTKCSKVIALIGGDFIMRCFKLWK